MVIAVASGKGGTGKTTVALNLARSVNQPVSLLDCDVEEPNAHLFLPTDLVEEKVVTLPVPEVVGALCNGCGECGKICEYNAIVSFGKKPMIFPEMCHGCGGCIKVCPRGALREIDRRIGVIETTTSENIHLTQGRLDIGISTVPPLIAAVRKHASNHLLTILDAPPGTSCPVVASLRETDFVLLVTEPTPFGLHDLTLAVEMVRELKIPFGVVVNRSGVGDDRVHQYCQKEEIPLLLEIPDDRRIAEAYSRGELIVDALPEYKPLFQELQRQLSQSENPA